MHRIEIWRPGADGLGRLHGIEAGQSSDQLDSWYFTRVYCISQVFIRLHLSFTSKSSLFSEMPSHCCVVGCTQRGYTTENGEKVSFFNFPKGNLLQRKKWIHAIRRDEGREFKITAKTKVCSLHFKPSDLKKTLTGRIHPLESAVPSKFRWSVSPKKRKPPKERRPLSPQPKRTRERNKQLDEVSSRDENDQAKVESTDGKVAEIIDPLELSTEEKLDEAQRLIKNLEDKLSVLECEMKNCKSRCEGLVKENDRLQARVSILENDYSVLSSQLFNVDRFSRDQDVAFYTGFPNKDTYNAILEYLDPGTDCENLRPKEKANESIPEDFYEQKNDENSGHKRGRRNKMKPADQFFIVMCRLRRGFSELHLAHLYGVAQSTISRLFVTWVNFMYLKFGQICIWPSQQTVRETMPSTFTAKYPKTRVIIDCTEVRCEMPSSLLMNSELFSSYKNHVTLKALVGISPSGAITFISQLYTGSISDREIVTRSGFLSQEFEEGDCVMADKGFQIQDLLPLGVTLNIPPFLGGDSQMSPEDVIKTQQIANLRIHVERAFNKIKNFHVWDRVIPLSMFGLVNQMWSVSAFLCNTHEPLITE